MWQRKEGGYHRVLVEIKRQTFGGQVSFSTFMWVLDTKIRLAGLCSWAISPTTIKSAFFFNFKFKRMAFCYYCQINIVYRQQWETHLYYKSFLLELMSVPQVSGLHPFFLFHSVWFFRKSNKESAPAWLVLGLCIWYSWASRNLDSSPAAFEPHCRMQASEGGVGRGALQIVGDQCFPTEMTLSLIFLPALLGDLTAASWLLPQSCQVGKKKSLKAGHLLSPSVCLTKVNIFSFPVALACLKGFLVYILWLWGSAGKENGFHLLSVESGKQSCSGLVFTRAFP